MGYGPLVRIAALADVLKVILYVVASFALAAVISPYLYELGKGFAHVTLSKDTADEVNWLAERLEKRSSIPISNARFSSQLSFA